MIFCWVPLCWVLWRHSFCSKNHLNKNVKKVLWKSTSNLSIFFNSVHQKLKSLTKYLDKELDLYSQNVLWTSYHQYCRWGVLLQDFYSFGNLVSCGNVAINKEHKLMLRPPFFHPDHLVIKVQITIWAPTPSNIHWLI